MKKHESLMVILALALLASVQSGCSDSSIGDCAFGDHAAFRSVDLEECGLGPDGKAYCRWSVHFLEDGTFSWSHSDVSERGTWTCEGTEVTGLSIVGYTIMGTYHVRSGTLTWAGVRYALQ